MRQAIVEAQRAERRVGFRANVVAQGGGADQVSCTAGRGGEACKSVSHAPLLPFHCTPDTVLTCLLPSPAFHCTPCIGLSWVLCLCAVCEQEGKFGAGLTKIQQSVRDLLFLKKKGPGPSTLSAQDEVRAT